MQNMQQMECEVIAEKLRQRLDTSWEGSPRNISYKQSLMDMEQKSANTFNRPVESSVAGLGRLVVVFKKIVRRCIAWYANPFAQQQTDFNNAANEASSYLDQAVVQLKDENRQLRKRLDKVEALLIEMQKQQETVE